MRFTLTLVLCFAALTAAGCAQRPGKEVRAPDRVSEHRPEDKNKKRGRPVVAPPPAYGNKVVMDDLQTRADAPERPAQTLLAR